ncbi:MAG: class I SAM-dependent methyltransferase [Pseudomonadota bacterium]
MVDGRDMVNFPINPLKPARASKAMSFIIRSFKLVYDRLPGSYNGLVGALGYTAPELVVNALAKREPFVGTVLDAGCGTGLTGEAIKQKFPDAKMSGFDLSPDMLGVARKTDLYTELKIADATLGLPFQHNQFDVAVSTGLYTLGHVGPEALQPVLDCVKPGGYFALTVFDAAWDELAFDDAIQAMVADRQIVVSSHDRQTHFGLTGQTCRVLVLQKCGALN